MHTRVLLDFFQKPNRKKKDVLAIDYDFGLQQIDIEDKYKTRLDTELAHLTYSRLERGPMEKDWDLSPIMQKMISPIKEFINHLLKSDYLLLDSKEYQEWKQLQEYISSIPNQKKTNNEKGMSSECEMFGFIGKTDCPNNFLDKIEKSPDVKK